MNSTKKNIQKTSGTRKNVIKVAYSGKYKPGQLVTINHRVFRIVKNYYCPDDCLFCLDRNYEKYNFCMDLPLGLKIKPIKKHKG